jgi:hypothetical protein
MMAPHGTHLSKRVERIDIGQVDRRDGGPASSYRIVKVRCQQAEHPRLYKKNVLVTLERKTSWLTGNSLAKRLGH